MKTSVLNPFFNIHPWVFHIRNVSYTFFSYAHPSVSVVWIFYLPSLSLTCPFLLHSSLLRLPFSLLPSLFAMAAPVVPLTALLIHLYHRDIAISYKYTFSSQ